MRLKLLVLLLLLLPAILFAKSIRFEKYYVEVRVNSDASYDVEEELSIYFDGSFTEGWRDIPLKGAIVKNVEVYEGNDKLQASTSESNGVETVTWKFSANNERKNFTIKYRMEKALIKHDDVAEFYYQFIGNQWEVPIRNVHITLYLPKGANKDEILAWGHGPPNGNILISDEQVIFTTDYLPSKTYYEGRVLFDSNLVSGTYAIEKQDRALQKIADEEEGKSTNISGLENLLGNVLPVFCFIFDLLFLIGMYLVWNKFGREFPTEFKGKYFREVPADYSPAILGCLLNAQEKKPGIGDFTAVIVDLAEKGYVVISEENVEPSGFPGLAQDKKEAVFTATGKDTSSLKNYEKDVLEWLFPKYESGERVSFKKINQRITSSPLSFQRIFEQWQENAKKEAQTYNFHDENSSRISGTITITGIIFLVLIFFSFFVLPFEFMDSFPIAMIALSFSLVLIIIVLFGSGKYLQRRTQRGAEDYAKWMALKNYISDFSAMEEHPPSSVALWDKYLVYAISLGVADKVIEYMKIRMPEDQRNAYSPSWAGGMNGLVALTTLSSMNHSFNSSLSSAMSYSSSGHGGSFHGSSGGFSGGGGHGGGGGGFR